ncbi:hypothetical protein [uncultured Pseudoalteromonas sp.]|uniref:tetratricopeptide repeat protein n=1 Tax=uncultured Pseudoalteromonas sp. TaxID=114053 RepID=UPI0030C7E917
MRNIYIFILICLTGCAHIDYVPSVNPHTALSDVVTKYDLHDTALTCEGPRAANCLSLVHSLNQLMLEHPNDKAILSLTAYALYKSGRADQAQPITDKLLNLPNPPLNSLSLAITLATEQGNLAKAKQIAQYAIDEFGTKASPYLQMAAIYYSQGRYVMAANYLELAYKFGTHKSLYYYHKGLIAEATPDNSLACHYYNQAMSHNPQYKQATVRYAKLSVLGNCN